MSSEINLLSKKKALSPHLQVLGELLQKFALGAVLFLVLFIVILLSLNIYSAGQEKGIKSRLDTATTQIEANKDTESLYLAYLQKLRGVDSIIKERFYAGDTIRKLELVMPPDARISLIDANPTTVSLVVDAESLDIMQKVMQGLQKNTGLSIKEISLSSMEKVKDHYSAKFSLTLGGNL